MNCQGCFSAEVPAIPSYFCPFCGRLVTTADVEHYHRNLVAPQAALQAALEDYALREAG